MKPLGEEFEIFVVQAEDNAMIPGVKISSSQVEEG